ncbi:hypothetical protein F5Y17DRAFT_419232 [Xylariaceae sp. FL0594]|nr:hypothetical protein F5Y17DRAFT_419232 [Xylariaceae sp. FL0594]
MMPYLVYPSTLILTSLPFTTLFSISPGLPYHRTLGKAWQRSSLAQSYLVCQIRLNECGWQPLRVSSHHNTGPNEMMC